MASSFFKSEILNLLAQILSNVKSFWKNFSEKYKIFLTENSNFWEKSRKEKGSKEEINSSKSLHSRLKSQENRNGGNWKIKSSRPYLLFVQFWSAKINVLNFKKFKKKPFQVKKSHLMPALEVFQRNGILENRKLCDWIWYWWSENSLSYWKIFC